MLTLKIIMYAHPSKRHELLQTLQSLLDFLPQEKGYRHAHVEMDWEQNAFTLVEEWDTQTDVDWYMQSEYFTVLRGAIKLLTSSSQFSITPPIPLSPDIAVHKSSLPS